MKSGVSSNEYGWHITTIVTAVLSVVALVLAVVAMVNSTAILSPSFQASFQDGPDDTDNDENLDPDNCADYGNTFLECADCCENRCYNRDYDGDGIPAINDPDDLAQMTGCLDYCYTFECAYPDIASPSRNIG